MEKGYYFDDITGKYVKKRRIKIYTILYHCLIGTIVSFVGVYFWRDKFESQEMRKIKNKYEALVRDFNKINDFIQKDHEELDKLKMIDDNLYKVLLAVNPSKNSKNSFVEVNDLSLDLDFESKSDMQLLSDIKHKIYTLHMDLISQEQSYRELQTVAKFNDKMLTSLPCMLPVKSGYITSGFGLRIHPIYKIPILHKGIDIAAKKRSPIFATGDGIVVSTRDSGNRGHGKHVVVKHTSNLSTLYAHMDEFIVRPGMRVKRGQKLGYVGSTGLSTGFHVHYEVIKNNKPVNPNYYLTVDVTPAEYNQIVKKANTYGMSLD